MKILFVYKYEFAEPIGIMALSAFLKQGGHICDFIDLAFERDYVNKIRQIRPDIIAYSITTGKHTFYQRVNEELKKELSFFAIFGGPHATFFPEFVKEEGVDAICRGEGEYPLLELADNLGSGKEYIHIQNLWVKQNGQIHRNEVRPLIKDLDTLPFPDRGLFDGYAHYKKLHRRMFLSGRGCPYNCSYCFNHSFNRLYAGKGKMVRKRSVDNVIKELADVRKKYNPGRFQFVDDTFILDQQWCLDFCKHYEKEIKTPFIAYTRVNLVTDELIKSLKQAGCIVTLYAIESGNDYIRNKILKRNISEQQIKDAVRIYKKYKLRTFTQNIVGIPDETLEMAFETLQHNIRAKAEYAGCSIFQPYPGTDLWDYCKEKGYLTGEQLDKSFYKKSVLNIKNKKEMERLHHLFPTIAAFPFLLPLARSLIRLPFSRLYFLIWHLHRAWGYFFKVKWIDIGEIFIFESRGKRLRRHPGRGLPAN